MKIITVVGARPQFIKAAVVSRAIDEFNSANSRVIEEKIVHTGQHYDTNMSDVFFGELRIPQPAFNLSIGGGSHGQNTGRMIEAIESVVLAEKPDCVLVYGDTDSTLAGTLASVKLNVPIAHVEAGLRSFNRQMPEEINRVLTDHASKLLFTPTDIATKNLEAEGIPKDRICQVGDVMFDAALYYATLAETSSDILRRFGLADKKYVLATIHRAENTECVERMREILLGFEGSRWPIVWPMHPRTRKKLSSFKLKIPSTVQEVPPVGYLDMVALERHAAFICTDSGGVQKEAFFHRIPCITIRDETEWLETIESGWNQLVAAESGRIKESFEAAKDPAPCNESELFGSGSSAKLIVEKIAKAHYEGGCKVNS